SKDHIQLLSEVGLTGSFLGLSLGFVTPLGSIFAGSFWEFSSFLVVNVSSGLYILYHNNFLAAILCPEPSFPSMFDVPSFFVAE
ncbi:MAG: hypothetical protein WBM32_17935, partial [Crocosphaera sp.]